MGFAMNQALHIHMIVELAHPLELTNLTTTHTHISGVQYTSIEWL